VETAYRFAHLALARHCREVTYLFNLAGRGLGLYNPERERQILSAHLQALQDLATLYESQGRTQDADALRQEYVKLSAE
jgi:hypothetical protein